MKNKENYLTIAAAWYLSDIEHSLEEQLKCLSQLSVGENVEDIVLVWEPFVDYFSYSELMGDIESHAEYLKEQFENK